MVSRTYESGPAGKSGDGKVDSPMPAMGPRIRLKMKPRKDSRNPALGNSAQLFPFGLPHSACAQESTASAVTRGIRGIEVQLAKAAYPDASACRDRSLSSETIKESLSPKPDEPMTLNNEARTDIYEIFRVLLDSPVTHIELPRLHGKTGSTKETPYSAETLANLYILCYKEEQWNLCDLVADTWARALQSANTDETNRHIMWRNNTALSKLQADGMKGFDRSAPIYDLDVEDPTLAAEVARFDENILTNIYGNTAKDCGARLLWADAMALCGTALEETSQQMANNGYLWHPELVFDIMCSSLRMVRRRLTMKIEEATEGAWCSRYHEHTKLNRPCYRWSAWQEQLARDKGDETREAAGARRHKKRSREETSGYESQSKRVRFNAEDVEVESESEEE
jgi:hypothetical protein